MLIEYSSQRLRGETYKGFSAWLLPSNRPNNEVHYMSEQPQFCEVRICEARSSLGALSVECVLVLNVQLCGHNQRGRIVVYCILGGQHSGCCVTSSDYMGDQFQHLRRALLHSRVTMIGQAILNAFDSWLKYLLQCIVSFFCVSYLHLVL